MADISQILNTLNTSPSIGLLRLRNREMIIEFLVKTFVNKQGPTLKPSFAKEPPSQRTKTLQHGQTTSRQKRSTNR
ncbi:MAG: hypothetical protein JSS93_00810 [Bacteroidetes bacterium]|nr:hypothetical protein [Bacteroidota bacterium]